MIPIELTVAGLHSYRDEVTVDFDEAVEDGLFGIFGPTGSGKSTLLDAMTLALYGTVDRLGGNEITPMLHVDADELTVTYTFELGGTTYQAHRRMVRSSDGAASQRDAQLRDLDADETLASQAREVTAAIEDVLGMTFGQFTRAVFLPQGKFARFLHDAPADRLDLLEEIFGLDRYGEQLRKRARDRRDAIRQEHNRIEGTLENELADVSTETVENLEEEHEVVAERVEALAEREDELAEQAEAARNLESTLEALETAREELAELEEQEDAIDAKRERLQLARAAETPNATLDDVDQARETLDEVQEKLAELEERVEEREQVLEEAKTEQAEREEALAERVDELADARARLEALTGDAKRLDGLRADRDEAEATLADLEDQRLEEAPEHVLDEHNADDLLATIQATQRARDRVERHDDELAKAQAARGKARWALVQHEQARAETQEEVDKLEEQLEAAQNELREAQVADRASALVTELEEDEPCPVCGSLEHPDPTSEPDTPIDELEARRDELDEELAEARDELARLEQAIENYETRREEARAEAHKAREAREKAREELAGHRENLPEVLRELEPKQARSKVNAWRRAETARQARETIGDVEDQLARARERFEVVRDTLELDAGEPTAGVLEAARETLADEQAMIETEREQLEDRVEQAAEELSEAKEDKAGISMREETIAEQVAEREERLADQLEDSPFDEADEVRQAHEPDAVRSKLEQAIESFDEQLQKARNEVERLEAEVDEAAFDAEQAREIVEEHAKVDEQLGEARTQAGEIGQRLKEERARLERKSTLVEKLEALDEKLTRAEKLTKLLGGRRFIEYLARNRFDNVLDQASRRLAQVSGGQYHLKGSPSEIHVVDQMAGGEERDLRTLSGGETFMVSLSLALALSDAIQHERGGGYPPIEFFFLDEGFGSLDQDTLDQVMRMLHELVDQDVRVGLITHVEDAKRYVPRQVLVEPATEEHGSRVEVIT